ncbi:MAG: sulfatase [Opitutaceae bacterium]|nr:sulfatase [Opitutaceae bacterium]
MKTVSPAATIRARHMLAALLALVVSSAAFGAASRKNVLFLFSDDLRVELGCYGTPGIRTPNIDTLAARSVRFERAYAQYPLCNPSRSSLLTGRYPTVTGVLDNRQWWGHDHPDWKSLPRFFKDHGYASLRTGKIFHGGIDDTDAWTEGGEKRDFTGPRRDNAPGQVPGNSDRIVVLEGDGEEHGDYRVATRAIDYLTRYKGGKQPFFLACGFSKPHSPPTAPKKMFDLYDPAKVPLPRDFAPRPTVPAGFPKFSVPARNSDLFIGRDASEEEARLVKRAYWASVSFMDAQVGRVLTALDRLGLRENTVIVFWGDHGYHLGEKGKWSKHYSLLEVGTRVPLLISAPGVAGNSQPCPRIVETLDLYPTLADLCGLPVPAGLNGVSLAPLLRHPNANWDRPAYSVTVIQDKLGRAVRTDKWRYAEWDESREGAVLFDCAKDPDELTNLAADPKFAATVKEMRGLLARLPGRTR